MPEVDTPRCIMLLDRKVCLVDLEANIFPCLRVELRPWCQICGVRVPGMTTEFIAYWPTLTQCLYLCSIKVQGGIVEPQSPLVSNRKYMCNEYVHSEEETLSLKSNSRTTVGHIFTFCYQMKVETIIDQEMTAIRKQGVITPYSIQNPKKNRRLKPECFLKISLNDIG